MAVTWTEQATAYVVTLSTPKGFLDTRVTTTLGPEAAGRRALMVLVAKGYGDIDEIIVTNTTTQ